MRCVFARGTVSIKIRTNALDATSGAAKMKPLRIQRQRTAGWKMPENTVYVGRGTEWGNPFKVGGNYQGFFINQQMAVALYRKQVEDEMPPLQNVKRNAWKLRGKNLACWCAKGEVCHADVLFEIANSDTQRLSQKV